jgi:hypothetical protein
MNDGMFRLVKALFLAGILALTFFWVQNGHYQMVETSGGGRSAFDTRTGNVGPFAPRPWYLP